MTMTTYWQTLIEQANTSSDNTGPSLIPLAHLGVLTVEGEDASSFLQNLLTNDLNALAMDQSQYSGLCNPKGRLLALFLILRTGETQYQLVLPNSLCDAISKRLSMYVLRSKVTVTNTSQHWHCIGLTDNEAGDLGWATTDYEGGADLDGWYTKLPAQTPRWLVLLPAGQLETHCQTLISQGYRLSPENDWLQLDIQSGLSQIYPETQEKFTPQQLNLDLINAVSFKKGCYPGQEVVARLHYLGNPNRRLFMASAETELMPTPGDEVKTHEGQVAGHVVSVCQNAGRLDCLLSLKLANADDGLVLSDNTTLTRL